MAASWDPNDCVVFRRTGGRFGGLSNMAPDFGVEVNGVSFRTSEALYQACRFPHLPEVQEAIIAEPSPTDAKKISRRHRTASRPDWTIVRLGVMWWCLRVKLAHNVERLKALLDATGDKDIVEAAANDSFWGAKPQEDGSLLGKNRLGLLLLELRDYVKGGTEEALRRVEPPPIPNFLLFGRPIASITT
jgi:type I restriction enzyme S subunit